MVTSFGELLFSFLGKKGERKDLHGGVFVWFFHFSLGQGWGGETCKVACSSIWFSLSFSFSGKERENTM